VDVVEFAFMPGTAQPAPSDWHAGSWDVTQTGGHIAQCLVGPDPGGVPLTVGTWTVWVRVDDNPEKIKRDVGLLAIY